MVKMIEEIFRKEGERKGSPRLVGKVTKNTTTTKDSTRKPGDRI